MANYYPGLTDMKIEQLSINLSRLGEAIKFTPAEAGETIKNTFALAGIKTNDSNYGAKTDGKEN